jgi:multiple sugar transport system substrate-binding protein
MQPEEIAAMSNATSLIPNTAAAAAMTENYKAGGKWRVFYDYSKKYAKMRPETPAYPVITSSFAKAVNDILDGTDVQESLDKAVETIERNIQDNNGYGYTK